MNRTYDRLKEVFRQESGYKAFFVSMLTFALAYGMYKGVIDNYLAEVVSMSGWDKGVSEFFREMPGLALVFVLAALYTMSAEKIYRIGAVIMLIGLAAQSLVPADKVLVILCIFVFSLGDHIQLGMRNTLTLQYSKEGRGGEALGLQNAVYQVGMLAGYAVIILVFWRLESTEHLFKTVFAVSAAIIGIGTLSTFRMTGASNTDSAKRRFYFRRKFTKYYMLEVFYGARKQVFFTFGPYVLVLFYGANAMTISILFAVSSICGFFASPLVGKIIDRFGYRIVMISDTLILVIVCFFYGFAHHIFPMHIAFIVCCVNYVLDSVISLASMASNVYVQDISDSAEEMRATISTGVSVNHLITIMVALFGGWIWKTLGIETLFMLSAVLGLCNSAYAATIKTSEKKNLIMHCPEGTMRKATIQDVLDKTGIMVIDGSMSAILEELGADNSSSLWTAAALAEQPELVKQVHLEYFRAGADCGITCSYQATIPGLTAHGYSAEEAEKIIADSVKMFLEAREEWWDEEGREAGRAYPVCLAGIGPYGAYLADGSEYRGNYGVTDQVLHDFHRRRMEILAEAGADMFLIETQPSFSEALIEAEIAEDLGVDYWISFSCRDGLRINEGDLIRDCAAALSTGYPRLKMIGVNCSKPEYIVSLIHELRNATDLPVGVYPNSGFIYDPATKTWVVPEGRPDFRAYALEYMKAGASAVGGCCTTNAYHIRQVAEVRDKYVASGASPLSYKGYK